MTPAETLILATYFFVLVILAVYGWHRYYLVYLYMKHKDQRPLPAGRFDALPRVTIQLPLYNEMYVVDRLVEAVCRIDYPRELLEIQVLDDSTDETPEIAELAVRRFAAQGIDIKYIHRTDRTRLQGRRARGRAARRARASSSRSSTPTSSRSRDFLHAHHPLLHRTRRSAMVQTRWGHVNEDYSLLTKIQAMLLDAHFVLEHGSRNRGGCFFNFNGTAGIWRRDGDRRRRRLAARHAHRGSRSELPRAAARLAVRVPARSRRAGRAAGRDERLQVAAASLGQGVDPDLPQADAAASCGRTSRSRSRPRRSSICRRTSTTR